MVIAGATGAAVAIAGSFTYTLTTDIAVSGRIDSVRQILVDVCHAHSDRRATQWRIRRMESAPLLQLSFDAVTTTSLESSFESLWSEFQEQIANANAVAESRRAQAETIIGPLIAASTLSPSAPSPRLPGSSAGIDDPPPPAPMSGLAELRAHIDRCIAVLVTLRNTETHALAELQTIESGADDDVVLADEVRREAYDSRDDLRQDLESLAMHLTLGQRFVLDIWQRSSAPLDDLVAAVARLIDDVHAAGMHAVAPALGDLKTSARNFQKRVVSLSNRWNESLSRLERAPINPLAPQLIDTHARLRELLSEFTHHGSRLLETMRDDLRRLDDAATAPHRDAAVRARRAFHRVESATRRFEFEASGIDPLNNPRLDGALRSITGLAHRTRIMMEEVNERLLQEELDRRFSERNERRRASLDRRESLRGEINRATDTLMTSILDYAAAVPQAADGLRREFAAVAERERHEFGDAIIEQFRLAFDRIRDMDGTVEPTLDSRIVRSTVVRTPHGVARRFGAAGLAAAIAFIALARRTPRTTGDTNGS